ncbi:GTP-binding protein gtr2 [Coemansia sp. RSA 989]|nr:GTP-binding protein gtr2 [Coemansia sp. RSA 1086]KAJ1753097.1 GTP-binding protein gtr2 [Coemansia sp. RSA 1821]KAJ1867984.1 GTP-binding protein gtr2 [Coemansia sp. RSA 989]KAJ1875337.1 GTP-binding protein gtr2 [Coemansia sp. RSA 990]KAJ2633817.1 GTP-binding protein gtr2 [Coemansia sp. RSA 1290]KAJ2651471.1 GTP-binding protein gtr2 [Coemansia sp. RSA 1250]KAJ2674304.1 GTP-binding protein gtr2 [Coemansia sp. RSA 1085]
MNRYTGSGRSVGVYGQDVLTAGPIAETGSESEIAPHKDEELAERRILFMGLPRSGKTSILKVIFEGEMAYDTLSLMPTQQRSEHRLITGISVYDFPGIDEFSDMQYSMLNPSIYAGEHTSLVFVMDSQSDLQSSLSTLLSVVRTAQSANFQLPINIFINKVDGLSEELKQDIQNDIQQRILKNMAYENLNINNVHVFLTTIFDQSIREALSRVLQYLVPKHSSLETILNSFCSKSSLDKVFLFDMNTKMYLATDSSPTYSLQYMFACQTIDVMEELTAICPGLIPAADDEDSLLQRINVGLDGNDEMFIYQVDGYLTLLCIGPPEIIRQTSLLEFNGSKVAKAIRQILSV